MNEAMWKLRDGSRVDQLCVKFHIFKSPYVYCNESVVQTKSVGLPINQNSKCLIKWLSI